MTGRTCRRESPLSELQQMWNAVCQTLPPVAVRREEVRPEVTVPPINAWQQDQEFVVEVELPGVPESAIELSVLGDTLSIAARREPPTLGEKSRWLAREQGVGAIRRLVQLPSEVEADKVAAVYQNGVLRVTLPQASAARPKKIDIRAN